MTHDRGLTGRNLELVEQFVTRTSLLASHILSVFIPSNALIASRDLSAIENTFCPPPRTVHISQSIDVHSYTFTLTGVPKL